MLPSLVRSSSERPRTQSSQIICNGVFGWLFHVLLPHWALGSTVVAFLFTALTMRTRRSAVLSTSDIGFFSVRQASGMRDSRGPCRIFEQANLNRGVSATVHGIQRTASQLTAWITPSTVRRRSAGGNLIGRGRRCSAAEEFLYELRKNAQKSLALCGRPDPPSALAARAPGAGEV